MVLVRKSSDKVKEKKKFTNKLNADNLQQFDTESTKREEVTSMVAVVYLVVRVSEVQGVLVESEIHFNIT